MTEKTYTEKEYFDLRDQMKKEIEKIHTEKEIIKYNLNNQIENLKESIEAERKKCLILQKQLMDTTYKFIDSLKQNLKKLSSTD